MEYADSVDINKINEVFDDIDLKIYQTDFFTTGLEVNDIILTRASKTKQNNSYYVGMRAVFIASTTNTGQMTANVDGLGSVIIEDTSSAGSIISGNCYTIVYDGVNFKIESFGELSSIRELEDGISNLEVEKEPVIIKNTGFNKNKSNSVASTSSDTLATSLAVKTAYDKGVEAKNIADGKEPVFVKNSGFNKNKSDSYSLNDSNVLATSKALKDGLATTFKTSDCYYGIGDYWITESTTNPATKWVGTTWTKVEGRVLLGTSSEYALGTQGGKSSISLALANMASHSHGFSGTTNTTGNHYHQGGNHRHLVDNHAHTQPGHTHNSGIGSTAGSTTYYRDANSLTGHDRSPNYGKGFISTSGGDNTGSASPYTNYQNPNTSTTGNHNHTISGTTGSSGSGSAFNIMNPYRVVNIWRRTA
jgi:hypothetical protein